MTLKTYLIQPQYHQPSGIETTQFYETIVTRASLDSYDPKVILSQKAHYVSATLNLAIALEKIIEQKMVSWFFYLFVRALFQENNDQIYDTLNRCHPDVRTRMFSVVAKFGCSLDSDTFNTNIKRMEQINDVDYLRVENLLDEYLNDPFLTHYKRLEAQSRCITHEVRKKYADSLGPQIKAIYQAFEPCCTSDTTDAEKKLIIKSLRLTNRLVLSPPGIKRKALLAEYQDLITDLKPRHNILLQRASLCMLALGLAIVAIGATVAFLNVSSPLIVPIAAAGTFAALGSSIGLFAANQPQTTAQTAAMQTLHDDVKNHPEMSSALLVTP